MRIKILVDRKLFQTTSALAILMSSIAVVPSSAFAQEVAQSAPAEASKKLETVLVVANKREQNILDVPAAVSAVSAESLENAGVAEFSDLTRVSPSLTIDEGDNTNNSSINLRGIGTYAFSIGVEPAVSVIVDDVPVVQQAQAFNTLNDIERIEVLRGPQGTLFGKNASAGVINIVTQAPSKDLTGSLEAILTDDGEARLNASLSGPIGDAIGFRVNGYTFKRDGYIHNLTTGHYLNDDEGWGLRGKFTADISERLDAQLILDYSKRDVNGTVPTYRLVPDGAELLGLVPASEILDGITPGESNYNVRADDEPLSNNEQFTGSVKFSYDLGPAELVSISSYQDWNYKFAYDVDGSDYNLAGLLSGGVLSGGIVQSGPFEANQFTQELRLVSTEGGAFDYLVGLWYSDSDTSRAFSRQPVFVADWDAKSGTKNLAAFAQGTYYMSDKWNLTAGVRVSDEKISVEFNDYAGAEPQHYVGDDSETAVTGKLALQYEFDNGLTAFGTVATGYKGQGYDVSSGFNQSRADNPVGAEHSVSYEAGLKGRIFDDTTQFSAVAFTTTYEDYQAQSSEEVDGLAVFRLNNVGKLRTQGLEFDLASQLNNNWRLDLSAALINATVKSFPGARCYNDQTVEQGCVGGVQDLAGTDLSNSPDVKVSIGATYDTVLPWNDINMTANANYTYQDDVRFDLFGDPLTTQDGYGIFNANVAFSDMDEHYRVSFFVQNLFEQEYASSISNLSGLFGGTSVLLQIKPRASQRYFGLRLKGSF